MTCALLYMYTCMYCDGSVINKAHELHFTQQNYLDFFHAIVKRFSSQFSHIWHFLFTCHYFSLCRIVPITITSLHTTSGFPSSSFSSSSGPGRATLPTPGTSAAWKAALWTKLEKLVNSIQKIYSQVCIPLQPCHVLT